MDAVGEALDTAITKVAKRRLASLSTDQSDQNEVDPGENRGVAPVLQLGTSPRCPGEPGPGSLCPGGRSRGSMTRETNITTGTKEWGKTMTRKTRTKLRTGNGARPR